MYIMYKCEEYLMQKGLLISFEGTDGCGKSTQIRLLSEYLKSKGKSVVISREPGGCKVGEKIRNILLNAENVEISPMCELFLYEAARAQHMSQVIEPALNEGKIVILDRFIDSTFAYQGYGRQLGEECVDLFNKYAINHRYPDITLMLTLKADDAFKRKGGNDTKDRMEMAGDDFFKRVDEGLKRASEKYSDRIIKVNVEGTCDETHKKICALIDKLLEK